MLTGLAGEVVTGFGVRDRKLGAVEYCGRGIGPCDPVVGILRRPLHALVLCLLREFGLGRAVFWGSMQDIGWGICCFLSRFLFFGWVALYSR